MPTIRLLLLITGNLRTLSVSMCRIALAKSSSSRQQWMPGVITSAAVALPTSKLSCASPLQTISRSVTMPISRSFSPIGMAPMSCSRINFASSVTGVSGLTQSTPLCITSLTFMTDLRCWTLRALGEIQPCSLDALHYITDRALLGPPFAQRDSGGQSAALSCRRVDTQPRILERARAIAPQYLGEFPGLQCLPRHRMDEGAVRKLPAPRARFRRLSLPSLRAHRRCHHNGPGVPPRSPSRACRGTRGRPDGPALRLSAHGLRSRRKRSARYRAWRTRGQTTCPSYCKPAHLNDAGRPTRKPAGVVKAALGTEDIPEIAVTSTPAPGVTHRWTNMTAFTDEVANARIWSGFHYRFSTRTGTDMGLKIGEYVVKSVMQPVATNSQ